MTWAHVAVSLLMKAANSAGVPPPAWLPVSAMAFCTSGSFRMRLNSACNLAMSGAGVPAGATMPCQL
ncbi:hypothetical protein G6F55_014713 [Rhizopus delemar]|nr:hypothetical protein G6F55_014713 [Rhizopus delemar]